MWVSLGDGHFRPNSMMLFRTTIYLWFLIHLLWIFPISDLLWASDSLIFPLSIKPNLINNFLFYLNYNREDYLVVLIIHGLSSLLALLGVGRWLPRILVYVSGLMMYFSAYLAFNSGFLLMLLFSFFLVFYDFKRRDQWSSVVSNFALFACILQLVIVYSAAAIWKWTGYTWVEGSAIHYTLYMDHFSLPLVKDALIQHPGVTRILSWIALAYQSLFAVIILIRRFRLFWLMIGVFFHLYIMIVMKMPDFGSAMIIGYLLFLDDAQASSIMKRIPFLKTKTAIQ